MLVKTLLIIVALIHFYFFILESYLYKTRIGFKTFALNQEKFNHTKIWAFNQGFYNLCLSIGLIEALITNNKILATYLLSFIIIVGLIGGISIKIKVFYLQALPAIIALISIWI